MSTDPARLSVGYQPDFDRDAAVGRQGELFVTDVIHALVDGSSETKHDARALQTGRVYIEYECLRGGVWRPSGIQTTKAEVWCIVLGGKVLVAMPAAVMRRVAERAWLAGDRRDCPRGSHPTRGVVVSLGVLLAWALDEAVA